MQKEETLQDYIKQVKREYSTWDYYYKNGGSDPFWADGCNMNLTRNHIMYFKNLIKDLCDKKKIELPEEYFKPLPIEVDNNYMAVPEKIQNNADKAYKIFCSTNVFEKLLNLADKLDKEKKQIALNIVGYKRGLKIAIDKVDLITMRRFNTKSAERIIEAAWKFIDENSNSKTVISNLPSAVQLSMF